MNAWANSPRPLKAFLEYPLGRKSWHIKKWMTSVQKWNNYSDTESVCSLCWCTASRSSPTAATVHRSMLLQCTCPCHDITQVSVVTVYSPCCHSTQTNVVTVHKLGVSLASKSSMLNPRTARLCASGDLSTHQTLTCVGNGWLHIMISTGTCEGGCQQISH